MHGREKKFLPSYRAKITKAASAAMGASTTNVPMAKSRISLFDWVSMILVDPQGSQGTGEAH
jgi:hypothetical protein